MVCLNKQFNTPIHELSLKLNNNNFFVKREDLIPFSFGGNKARKAAYFFEDIRNKESDIIVTYGSGSSNHCRVVVNKAISIGIKTIIVSPEEQYCDSYNSKLIKQWGAVIIKTPVSEVSKTIEEIMSKLRLTNNPYFIQGGGHGNLGTQAYVDAYYEICEYESNHGMNFDYIFHASGTGTTQAGLVAGKILKDKMQQQIVGISIARSLSRGKKVVADSVNKYLSDGMDYSKEVEFVADYTCGGYGKYNNDIMETIKNAIKYDGVPFNIIYSGKAFTGMKKYILENNIKDKNILFINTGGVPLFFDDMEIIQ